VHFLRHFSSNPRIKFTSGHFRSRNLARQQIDREADIVVGDSENAMSVPDHQPHNHEVISPGDALIQAIADAVASRLQRWAGCTQRLLDIDQAAAYLGMTAVALRHKAACGEVVVVKIDAKLRFDRRDLDRFIDGARREGV
jgi:hypothetical protein